MFNDDLKTLLKHVYTNHIKYDLTLFAYFGPANPTVVADLKQKLPSNAVILYILPALPDDHPFAIASDPEQLLLTTQMHSEPELINLLYLVISCLKFRKVNIGVSDTLRPYFKNTPATLQAAATESLQGLYHEKMCRLLNLRAGLQNLRLICSKRSRQIPTLDPAIPVVICSAGPSLKTQLDELKRIQHQVYLIAVGRIFYQLKAAGIQPDFVVEMDPVSDLNWVETHQQEEDIALIATTNVSPLVSRRFSNIILVQGESIYFNRLLDDFKLELPKVDFNISVVIIAIEFAVQAGTQHIALLGNDFCLGKTGDSHLDGGVQLVVDPANVFTVAGNDNSDVQTVKSLNQMRLAMESYLLTHRNDFQNRQLTVHNATAHGALIQHTQRTDLASIAALNTEIKQDVDLQVPEYQEFDLNLCSGRIVSQLNQYQEALGKVNEALNNQQPEQLNTAFQSFYSCTADGIPSIIAECLNETVDELFLESSLPTATTPESALSYKFQYHEILLSDFISEFANLATAPNSQPVNHRICKSFRILALDRINRNNPELAQRLEQRFATTSLGKYDFVISPRCGRFLPFMNLLRPDGTCEPLNSGIQEMEQQARQEVAAFLAASPVKTDHAAVVFYGPANWLHPVVFAEDYPGYEIMVIDPWPAMLDQLIDYSLFLHKLPQNTIISAIHSDLPQNRSLIQQQVAAWQAERMQIMIFRHPGLWQIPKVQRIFNSIEFNG